jgi:hypothetical protein
MANYPLLSEQTSDLIKEQLQSYFNANLATVDFQYQDGLSIEQVSTSSIFISDLIESLELPSIYILTDSMAFNYSDNPNYLESDDAVLVVLSCEEVGGGANGLTRKLYRYGRALYASLGLVDLATPDGRLKIKLIPKRMSYLQKVTAKQTKERQRFKGDVVLELNVKHYEKFLS